VKNRDVFNNVEVVKEEAIFDLDEEKEIINCPGPRLVEGAKAIGSSIYSEYYGL